MVTHAFSKIINANHYYLVCIPGQTIITLIALSIGIKLWFQIYTSSNQVSMSGLYKNMTIICSISCVLCLISDLSHIYWCFGGNIPLFAPLPDRIYSIADFFYYVATNAFYIIAFLRLYLTFKDTEYRLSQRSIYLIRFFLFISICTAIYYVSVVTMMTSVEFFYHWAKSAIIILMINDCILNSTLMILFVKRLRKTIAESETNNNWEWNNDDSGMRQHRISKYKLSFSQFSRLNKSIIDIITLHTCLFGLAIFSNQLFLASLLSGFWWIPIQYYIFLFRGLECCANVIVLFLSLKPNRRTYTKWCKICHVTIKECCIQKTKNTVKKNIYYRLNDSKTDDTKIANTEV